MDAYQFLRERNDSHLISIDQFYQLVIDFQNDYLKKRTSRDGYITTQSP